MAIREIHLLHHTHVDVGYTDLQPIIYDRHVEFLEQVLDYCRQTDDYPDDARFRWVSEFSWPVLRFLEQRPARASELFERLRQGRVELAALYLDPTELADRRSFEVALEPALRLGREQGFPVTCVMTSDIPGQGWALADIMAEKGLPYLSVSPNSMVSKPILVDRPFHWVGPQGGQVLCWRTDWRRGWYGEGHVLGFPQGLEVARARVGEYLELLAGEDYPWEVLLLHLAADNYPPSRDICDLVAAWNEAGDLPRLRLSTNREFFERMIELHGHDYPTHRAAWPDWWSEGLGSAAVEVALVRETHRHLTHIEALAERLGEDRDLWPIWQDLLLFEEHTWGSSNMATEPHSFASRASWHHKATHIYRAADSARRLTDELARRWVNEAPSAAAEDFRDQTVRETNAGAAVVSVCSPRQLAYRGPVALPGLRAEVAALAAGEQALPVQRSLATPLCPADAWAVLTVTAGEIQRWSAAPSPEPDGAPTCADGVLANEFYELRFTPTGRVTSLLDRISGRELLDTDAPWGLGETVHECITGAQDRRAVWERGYGALPYGKRRSDAPFQRQGALAEGQLIACEAGPVFAGFTWRSSLPDARQVETAVRLWHGLRRIDVEVRVDKQAQESYESLYVAFPFDLDQPRGFIHSCDALFEAETEQLPGTCRDYYAVEDFAALAGEQGWAALCPLDAPLVQLGAITFGRWADQLRLDRGCLYSWLTNNFWYTNFPGYQLGHLRFRYALTTGLGELPREELARWSRGVRLGVCTV